MAEVQETRVLPAEYIEALGKTYASDLTQAVGGLKTIDLTKLYGPQFVAGPGAFTTQAEQLTGGLGSYAPYLQAAGRLAGTAERTLGGLPTDIATARGTLTGVPSDIAASQAMLGQAQSQLGGLPTDIAKARGTLMGVPSDIAASQAMLAQAQSQLGGLPTDIAGARGQLGTAAGDVAAARGMISPTAYQAYMSPYQQDVISTALQEYDIQAQKGAQGVPAAAIAAGAFGGGREGIARAEYQAASDRNRAALQAQLLQQGFGQAQQLAQQAQAQRMGVAGAQAGLIGQELGIGQAQLAAQLGLSGQQAALAGQRGALGQLRGQLAGQQLGVGQAQLGAQMGLAGQQLGLGQFQAGLAQTSPALVGQQISALTGLGAQQEARAQAQLEAQRQLAYQQAYQPYQASQALGQGVMGLISGYPAQTQQTITPSPSPLTTALGTASTLAGIYKLVGQGTQAFGGR